MRILATRLSRRHIESRRRTIYPQKIRRPGEIRDESRSAMSETMLDRGSNDIAPISHFIHGVGPEGECHPPVAPIRILTFVHSFDPGGVERVAFRLNKAWSELGAETRIIVGANTGTARDAALGLDCKYLSDAGERDQPVQLWRIFRQLPRMIHAEQPDILFCAGNTYAVFFVMVRLILGKSCPPIVAKISNDLTRRDMPWLTRQCYYLWLRIQGKLFAHFVGMAPAMRLEIATRLNLADDRISIIHDPILRNDELQHLARPLASDDQKRPGTHFISVGRLVPQKNFSLLLKAFARIARPDDRLTILGEGTERGLLERCAADLGIANRLSMPGHINALEHGYSDSAVFVMSSDFEGVPAAIIEAIAAGLTIVTTNCSVSMPSLLGEGRFGTLVPVGDVVALADAMDAAREARTDKTASLAHVRQFSVEAGAAAYLYAIRGVCINQVSVAI